MCTEVLKLRIVSLKALEKFFAITAFSLQIACPGCDLKYLSPISHSAGKLQLTLNLVGIHCIQMV